MDLFLSVIILCIGFVILIKGADYLVEGASTIAKRFQISDLVIGLTIVSLGTSMPELFVNMIASSKGNTDIAIGNILGSNIANICLILGISSIIYPLHVKKGLGMIWKGIPLSLLSAIILGILANDQLIDGFSHSILTRSDGYVCISFFIIFMYFSFSISKNMEDIALETTESEQSNSIVWPLIKIVIGLLGLSIGGDWIVSSAVKIASYLGMSESLTGLTIVAIGTSLPELATSAMAAYRKNVEIAVGNVVGSNITNIFLVLGISSIIQPLPFNVQNNRDISLCIIANLWLFISMFTGKKRSLDRWEGIVLICIYIGYISFLIYNG